MAAHETNTTLWQRWSSHAQARPDAAAVVHCVAGEEPFTWRWAQLLGRAMRYAAALAAHGVKKGDVCATVLRHNREFYPLYMAIEAVGALPAVLAYPNPRLHPDKFRSGLEGIAHNSGLDWLLTQRELEPLVRPLATGEKSTIRDVLFPLEWEKGGELNSAIAQVVHVDPS